MAKKRSSSKAWLKEHRDDPYVQQAQRDGYRSRACYKLLELQERDRLIRPGMTVVDLGSAPGGWSQVSADLVGHKGRVVASVSPTLFAPAEGTITLMAEAGMAVTTGQVLAEIDSPELENRLAQEQATLDSMAVELERHLIVALAAPPAHVDYSNTG